MRTIVVTGVAGYWGRRVGQRLLQLPDVRMLGIDRRMPASADPRLDFIKADVRNPLLVDLFRAEQVDTVVHLAWRDRQWRQEEDFDSNVLGTMQLAGACADAGVKQLVFMSTSAVYGAWADNPLYMAEDFPLTVRAHHAWVRDAVGAETFLQEFAGQYPELSIAVLRFANIVGPDAPGAFMRLLQLRAIPQLLGFDPLLQLIHADDVVEALAHAVATRFHGPVNVAAGGLVTLWQAARLAGKPVVPVLHLLLYWGWPLLSSTPPGRSLLDWFPYEPDYLRYPCTGDLTMMHDRLQFQPRLRGRDALLATVEARRVQRYESAAETQRFADDHLEQVVSQRRQANSIPLDSAP